MPGFRASWAVPLVAFRLGTCFRAEFHDAKQKTASGSWYTRRLYQTRPMLSQTHFCQSPFMAGQLKNTQTQGPLRTASGVRAPSPGMFLVCIWLPWDHLCMYLGPDESPVNPSCW